MIENRCILFAWKESNAKKPVMNVCLSFFTIRNLCLYLHMHMKMGKMRVCFYVDDEIQNFLSIIVIFISLKCYLLDFCGLMVDFNIKLLWTDFP